MGVTRHTRPDTEWVIKEFKVDRSEMNMYVVEAGNGNPWWGCQSATNVVMRLTSDDDDDEDDSVHSERRTRRQLTASPTFYRYRGAKK